MNNNPLNVSYTLDNGTWKDITTNADISVAANRTWVGGLSGNPGSGSGVITTFNAPTSGYFKLKVQARDVAGNTSSFVFSQPFNTGSWQVYAGTKDRGDNGTGRSAIVNASGHHSLFAINPLNGDMYAVDEARGIRKLDAKTGLVSTFIKHGTNNLPASGALPASPVFPSGNYTNLIFDSKGRLYLGMTSVNASPTATIYQIDIQNSTVRLYLGGGIEGDAGTGIGPTDLQVGAGGYSFDEQNSFYFWTYCGGALITAATGPGTPRRILKLTQNVDGSPGTLSRVIGNCVKADPTSGALAYSQPATTTTSSYAEYASIIPWDNGDKILVIPYGGTTSFKILGDKVYLSNVTNMGNGGYGVYNSADGRVYKTNANSIEKVLINTSGANGDVATSLFTTASTVAGCSLDGTSKANYCGTILTRPQMRSGILYFADGAGINAPSSYSIRFFDDSNQLRTIFGSQPFSGDGTDK
ncbi:MAG: hypothetical protein EOP50_10085, partial [Sphingobacteriales bacterium]